MKKIIKVSPPVNLSEGDNLLFNHHLSYPLPNLKVKYLKGPLVTASGLVCGRKGLINECYHYTMPGEHDERLNEASHYYHAVNDEPEKLITLDDDETYLLVHHTWHNNYYHWMCETLLRVWMVAGKTEEMVLLLPAKSALSHFALPSLEPFMFKNVFHIPPGQSVLVRTLCVPQHKPIMAAYIPAALNDLRKILVDHFSAKAELPLNLSDRVYVSRRKSRRRTVMNEDDVIEVMKAYGFDIVYNEEYSFTQQVLLYAKVRHLVSIHGAGLTNMMFMPPESVVFEFHKRQTNATDQHSLIFWYMADALGHRYYQQMCEPVNTSEDFFEADMVVDISLLKRNMKAIFSDDL
nr:glycosyltransferase family 61 protein [uncultured Mucilaginibacter sp.]